MKLEYNGVTLECDVFDAETADIFQEQTNKILETSKAAAGMSELGKAIRLQCKAIFEFIDALFGEGTHRALFGESVNLRTCTDVYAMINDAILEDKDKLLAKGAQTAKKRKK